MALEHPSIALNRQQIPSLYPKADGTAPLQAAISSAAILPQAPGSSQPAFGAAFPNQLAFTVSRLSERVLLPVAEAVTEIFLWAFIAQDVVSMWMPRISKSLNRGRIPYDIDEDPSAKHLTGFARSRKQFQEWVKRGNWVNLGEETKREMATGPLMLGVPALIYSVARRMKAKNAVELGYGPLTKMTDTFVEHLRQGNLGANVSKAEFKQSLSHYVTSLFNFDGLNTQGILLKGEPFKPTTPVSSQAIQDIKGYVKDWSTRWADAAEKAFDSGKKADKQALEGLNHELVKKLAQFNRVHLQLDLQKEIEHVPVRLLYREKDNLASTTVDALKPKSNMVAVSHLVEDLTRFKDFAFTALEEKIKHGGSEPLADVAKTFYQKLVGKKFGLTFFILGVASLFFPYLAWWAQSHDAYAGNRLLRLDKLDQLKNQNQSVASSGANPTPAPQSAPSQSGNIPYSASNPFVTDPASAPTFDPALSSLALQKPYLSAQQAANLQGGPF